MTAGPMIARAGRPRRDPDQPAAQGRPLRRRDPPPVAAGRGDPLPGHGGFPPRHPDRRGADGPHDEGGPAALHARRRHDAAGPAVAAAPRPVRHRAAARLLRRRRARDDRARARPASSASGSSRRPPREIGGRSRGTPRIANRLLRRLRDFAEVGGKRALDLATAREALKRLEVDEHGFDELDRRILQTIIEKFGGGPVGVARDRRLARRGPRHARGPLRALPHPGRVPPAHAERPRRVGARLSPPGHHRAATGTGSSSEARRSHLQPHGRAARPARRHERADRQGAGRRAGARQRADLRARRRHGDVARLRAAGRRGRRRLRGRRDGLRGRLRPRGLRGADRHSARRNLQRARARARHPARSDGRVGASHGPGGPAPCACFPPTAAPSCCGRASASTRGSWRNVPFSWKRRFGRAGILVTGVAEFARYEFPRLEATVDGAVARGDFRRCLSRASATRATGSSRPRHRSRPRPWT